MCAELDKTYLEYIKVFFVDGLSKCLAALKSFRERKLSTVEVGGRYMS
jgi:hypothetical protein